MITLRTTATWLSTATMTAALVGCAGKETEVAGTKPDIFLVQRGDLRISVRESGEVKALRETRVRSEVEGQATIIFLVPEGSRVQKGDKLVELDASGLQDREANQAITVERAHATLVNAQQNVEILDKDIQAEQSSAASQLEIAQINLEKYVGKAFTLADRAEPAAGPNGGVTHTQGTNQEMLDRLKELVSNSDYASLTTAVVDLLGADNLERDMGDMAQQVLDQIDKIRLAHADLKLKEDTLEHSKRLADKDYITRNELERHRLDYASQESRVTLSWNELDLLINYGLRSEKIDLELKVDNAQLQLDKVKASATARRAREAAELKSRQSEYDLAKERLDNLRKQIANAVIYAPGPGLVVYAQVGDGRRSREVVEEGMTVRERQSLIILPDVTTMIAELKVPEADIDKVARNQKAQVEVDAFPDKAFPAIVTRVSPLPDSGSRWSNNNKKVYKTEVTLEGTNTLLRPGMSSTVEILIGRIRDVINVPLQAVRRQGAVHYVWRLDATNQPVAHLVKVGRNNLTHVEIIEGLEAGERVLLSVPTDVQVPEFEQPEHDANEPEPPSAEEVRRSRKQNRPEGDAPGEQGGRRSGRRGSSAEYDEFKKLVKSKLPEFAETIDSDRSALFRNKELREAIQADPELKKASDAVMASFRSRFGGGRGRRGGGRSDDR